MGLTRIALIIDLLLVSAALAEPKASELGAKGSSIDAPATTQSAATRSIPALPVINPTLDHGHDLYVAKKYDEVHDLALDWLKNNLHAPDRDRGLMLLAETYYMLGQRLECFYQCDELLDTQAESKLFFPALELQYRVADEYLRGAKNKFLGMAILPMDDLAIEMLYRIQERAPGAPIAERSLRRSADFYYHTSQFDLAADAYGAFIRIFPRSTEVPHARLRQAYSNFAQFRGPPYDITPLLNARAEFVDITQRTPDMAQEEGVQQFIDRIDEQLAAKIASDADYYVRARNPKSAVFLYRMLIQRYPTSRDAEAAKKTLEKMPAWALAEPPPPVSDDPLPTSRPGIETGNNQR